MEPTIYLTFKGNFLEAMTLYAETLGGKTCDVFRNGDAPDAQNRMPGGDDLIMNMSLKLGDAIIMASDSPPDWYRELQGFSVSISPKSLAEVDRVYQTLSKDAKSIMMPLGETFWAERFAAFTDRFGTPWMINFAGSKAAS